MAGNCLVRIVEKTWNRERELPQSSCAGSTKYMFQEPTTISEFLYIYIYIQMVFVYIYLHMIYIYGS